MAPGMAHNPSQPGAQQGGIPPHLAQQMGVSAPGGQVNPSLMGMPGAPNAHALQHLNPQVQHMFGQQPANNCESLHLTCAAPPCPARTLNFALAQRKETRPLPAKCAPFCSTTAHANFFPPVAAQQMQQQRLHAIQQQRQQQMLMQQAQQMGGYMGPNGMPMGNNMMQIHPNHMAQIQAMQARQMAQRQVGLALWPPSLHAY